jgi:hypothetical protein
MLTLQPIRPLDSATEGLPELLFERSENHVFIILGTVYLVTRHTTGDQALPWFKLLTWSTCLRLPK